ncbi:VanZ family protein [Microbulbifer sp. MLAF003]|uniref:VanZ family protein n=1 Tax=Microbulbifer sp. MLAF003 TaxID=3032582 RepID=UPI0024AD09D7|nr:VanZ family protein [Microbulbifer sp. MLAF003]WHI51797.1 VanZ family protein [Microbulbifer sp. MLAF003]
MDTEPLCDIHMQKILALSTILFFGFILWVIYLANTGSSSIFFELVRAIPYGDKIRHIVLFGTLTLILTLSSRQKFYCLGSIHIYYGAIAVFLFALSEEVTQAFLPSRTFDFIDLAADLIGIGIANITVNLLQRREKYI